MIAIRPGSADDAEAISAVAKRAKAAWGYPPAWLASWRDALTVSRGYLEAHQCWVATRDGDVVGVCVLEARDGRGSLEHVWIAPEAQGQGFGRMLVEAALDTARRDGLREVLVTSDPFAEPFYLRLGARRCGEQPAPMPGAPDRVLPLLTFELDNAPAV